MTHGSWVETTKKSPQSALSSTASSTNGRRRISSAPRSSTVPSGTPTLPSSQYQLITLHCALWSSPRQVAVSATILCPTVASGPFVSTRERLIQTRHALGFGLRDLRSHQRAIPEVPRGANRDLCPTILQGSCGERRLRALRQAPRRPGERRTRAQGSTPNRAHQPGDRVEEHLSCWRPCEIYQRRHAGGERPPPAVVP